MYSNGWLTKYSECNCSMNCDSNGIHGKATPMINQGNGKFICPKCKRQEDYSEYTFKIRVKVAEDEEGYKIGQLIDGEERINKQWHDDKKYLGIKETIDEEFAQGEYEDWVKEHEIGIYELEIYYQPYTIATLDGTLYEVATEIFVEKKLD